MIDHHADATLADTKLDMSRPLSFDAVMELVERGYAHAVEQDALGLYAHLDPILHQHHHQQDDDAAAVLDGHEREGDKGPQ